LGEKRNMPVLNFAQEVFCQQLVNADARKMHGRENGRKTKRGRQKAPQVLGIAT
jgi:hypothetical protein